MGNRITNLGMGTIIDPSKYIEATDAHCKCIYRFNGKCVNGHSKWLGKWCKTVGNQCKDYTSPKKKKVKKNVKTVENDDLVILYSQSEDKYINIIADENDDVNWHIMQLLIGKSKGETFTYEKKHYMIKSIIRRK